MNNFWTTFSHTALKRIKSKAFIMSTAIMALLIIGLLNIPQLIDTFAGTGTDDGEAETVIYVLDESEFAGELGEALEEQWEDTPYLYREEERSEVLEEAEQEEEYVLILEGEAEGLEVSFYGDGPGLGLVNLAEEHVQASKEQLTAEALDLSEDEADALLAPVTVMEYPFADPEDQPEEAFSSSYWMVYGLVFVIYLVVITFGSMIATEVATEKSSRVMELIVSSISPITQMFGKLLGIGAAGAVNITVLAGAVAVGSLMSGEDVFNFIFTEVIEPSLLVYALLFIILGYFVYGGLAAMVGALVSRAEEVNQALQPLIFLAMIAFFLSIIALNAPELTVFRVLSYIPFFTPQLLFLRIGMGTVPGWEIALIIGILIVSAILINLLAARIYKGGVLMYGKFSFKNGIKQAMRLSKKEK